jgi:hypothetical protein
MSTWSFAAWGVGVGAAFASIAGCSVDTTTPVYSFATSSGGSSGGSVCGGSGSGTGSAHPMLVDVDPDRTLNASGGQGVGVFTEYMTGGHWHIWWTCDTNVSGSDCQYSVSVSVASGEITNFGSESLENGDTAQVCSSTQVAASTNTAAGIDGITFDTSPGAIITVDAIVNGTEDGSILFFVQDGVVNGGYTGALTDPLMFEPASQ